MLIVNVIYPNSKDSKFDVEYYLRTHIPLVENLLGDKCKKVELSEGVAGVEVEISRGHIQSKTVLPAYIVIAQFYFESTEDMEASLLKNLEEIVSDISKFTNVKPTVLISTGLGKSV